MAILSRKYGLNDPNGVPTQDKAEKPTIESARLPHTYGEEIFETLPDSEDEQARKAQLELVEHPQEVENVARHSNTGTDIQVQQIMRGSENASDQSAEILNMSEEDICKEFNLEPNVIRDDLENLFNNISDVVNILAPNFKKSSQACQTF